MFAEENIISFNVRYQTAWEDAGRPTPEHTPIFTEKWFSALRIEHQQAIRNREVLLGTNFLTGMTC